MSYFDNLIGAFQAQIKKELAAGRLELVPRKEDQPAPVQYKRQRSWSGEYLFWGTTDAPAANLIPLPPPVTKDTDYELSPILVMKITNQELLALGYTHFRFAELSRAVAESNLAAKDPEVMAKFKTSPKDWVWYLPEAYNPIPSNARMPGLKDTVEYPTLFPLGAIPISVADQTPEKFNGPYSTNGSLGVIGITIPSGALQSSTIASNSGGNLFSAGINSNSDIQSIVAKEVRNYMEEQGSPSRSAYSEHFRFNSDATAVSFDEGVTWHTQRELQYVKDRNDWDEYNLRTLIRRRTFNYAELTNKLGSRKLVAQWKMQDALDLLDTLWVKGPTQSLPVPPPTSALTLQVLKSRSTDGNTIQSKGILDYNLAEILYDGSGVTVLGNFDSI